MTGLPQDRWPLEKRQEHHRRRWWKYVCAEEDYIPSIRLDILVEPYSSILIFKTSIGWAVWKPGDFICENEYSWDWLSGYFRVYQDPDGWVHTDPDLAKGIRYHGVRSATRSNYESRMSQGRRLGAGRVAERRNAERMAQFQIKQAAAEAHYAAALETTRREYAEREFKKRTRTSSKGAKASTALFFKLAAATSAIS